MIIVRPSEHSLSFDGNEEMTKLEVNCLEVENAYRRLDKHYEAVLSAEAELRLLRATGVIDLLDHMRKIDSASLQLAWHALAVVQAADCATAAVGSLGLWVNRLLDASHEDKLALLHKVNAIVCQQLIDRTSLLIELSRRRVVELLDDQIDIAIDTLAIRTFRARSACDHVWSWLSRELEIQPQ